MLKATRMVCVSHVLKTDELSFLPYLGQKKTFGSAPDGFITKSRLQSIQDDNLVKYLDKKKENGDFNV